MKKSVMRKWVKALRSGKYKQAQGALQTRDGYCCLGVLCDISKISYFTAGYYLKDHEFPPAEVQEYAGLQTKNGYFTKSNGNTETLSVLNDGGHSFKYIARIIERFYKLL